MKKNPFAQVVDPVCKMKFPAVRAADTFVYKNTEYYFCNQRCKEKFAADPERFLDPKPEAQPVSGGCCCCREAFEDDESILARRLKNLRGKFAAAAGLTVLIVLLQHSAILPEAVINYAVAVLTTVTVFGPGGFLLKRGLMSLKGFNLNMFTLISMGIGAAYFYSLYALFFAFTLPRLLLTADGNAVLHFLPAAMITTLVILGQYLEGRASAGAGRAVRSLMELVPPKTHRVNTDNQVTDVTLDQVKIGDLLKVLPMEKIPVDGVIAEGSSSVDESMLTGESLLIEKFPGSMVAAGTLNGSGVLLIRAVKVGGDTLLAQIIDLVRSARQTRLPIQNLADKVSAFFVPAVLAAALASLLYWGVAAGSWSMALGNFIAVLLAACPCALGLAAPLAVTVGIGAGARHGILIKDPSILEKLRKIDTVMLDKTGTLTENKPQIKKFSVATDCDRTQVLKIALALENNSDHPLANALKNMPESAELTGTLPVVTEFAAVAGLGVKGKIGDTYYYLGSSNFMKQHGIEMQSITVDPSKPASIIMLSDEKRLLGCFIAGDKLRSDALEAVAELRSRHLDLVILSGDNPAAVKDIALQLGIGEFYGELTPEEKLTKVKARQSFGRFTAMVGDGVNDAAALAAADAGIAMGGGTDAALANAGVTLLAGNIGKLGQLFRLSQAVNSVIKQNLVLAFLYNMLLIPLAAGAFYRILPVQFSPVCSSIAMSGSCLLVVFNSLKLCRFNLHK